MTSYQTVTTAIAGIAVAEHLQLSSWIDATGTSTLPVCKLEQLKLSLRFDFDFTHFCESA